MRKFPALVMITLLTLVTLATANPVDPDPDQMGIYFDDGATLFDVPDWDPPRPINIYIMLTRPTCDQIWTWQCRVIWDQMGVFSGNWYINGINFGDLTDPMNLVFKVMYPTPSTTTMATILATWSGYWTSGPGACFYITDIPDQDSFDDPSPIGYGDGTTFYQCGVSSGDQALPVASLGIGCSPIVENHEQSWSTIKKMFR